MKKTALVLFTLVVFGIGKSGLATEPQFTAVLDKQTVTVNEEIHLNVKVAGAKGSLQAPKLPSLANFEIFYSGRSSQFSFINGRSESMTEFNYVMIPKTPGQFVLQPLEININGKVYQSDKINITVLDNQSTSVSSNASLQQQRSAPTFQPQATPQKTTGANSGAFQNQNFQQAPPAASAGEDQHIFLRVNPSKVTVYTNEQLLLVYSLYTNLDTRYEGFEQEPETSGFWIEEFPMEQDLGRDTEMVGGRKYIRADIKKIALFPTAAGEYWIKPGVIKASIQIPERSSSVFDEFFNDSFFSGAGLFGRREDKKLTQPPIRIEVKSLPDTGKPASFKGAVGEYRMSTGLDKKVVNQNEALTLTINIEGEGNIETLSPPIFPQIADVKVYESDTKSQLFRVRNVIAGKKTFEMIMIPGKAGELAIPSLEFSFFNPKSGQYVMLKSEAYKVQVNPSSTPPPSLPKELILGEGGEKKEVKKEGEDIHYIREMISVNSFDRLLLWFEIINFVLTVTGIVLIFVRRRDEFFAENISFKRTYFAKKYARQGLKRLNKLAQSSESGGKTTQQFFDESARILNQYLADKLNLSSHGLTQDIVERHLLARDATPETLEKIRECYGISDQVRFGKMTELQENRRAMIERIQQIMEELERL